ncbi:hypothetical protein J2Y74_003674 [Pseudomonas migulae]|uniref:hypothetical protein n=1 Tax=Pseudomonas migulae TaxID=78543 RepID=UPI0020A1E039|nr:hypothetical protein [Pseudomonas migulae]MCP1519364.1 hypothetical protein [Pseudomonas migulae]
MTAPKTGGRRRGSLDKGERAIVTAEMAGDLLTVYKKLGGVKWLLKFAEDNPGDFLKLGLSRLFPAAAKDDDAEPGSTYNQQFNIGQLSSFEAARRVAFAIATGIDMQQELNPPVIERVPGEIYDVPRWIPPSDAPSMTEAEAFGVDQGQPLPQPTRTPGFTFDENDPRPYQDQHDAWQLTKNTRECDITNYRGGSSGEQGGSGRGQPQVISRRTSAREIMNRRRDLLL